MQSESHLPLTALKVDGGAAANAMLLQFQADLLNVSVRRPVVAETTALGAAYLAGLAVGFWKDQAEIAGITRTGGRFEPEMPLAQRDALVEGWRRAVERAKGWASEGDAT
jgi:glycerol kinase